MIELDGFKLHDGAVMASAAFDAQADQARRDAEEEQAALDVLAAAEARAAEIIALAEAQATQIEEAAHARNAAREAELQQVSDEALSRYLDTTAIDHAARAVQEMLDQSARIQHDFNDMAPWFRPLIRKAIEQIIGQLPEETVWTGLVEQALNEVRDRWDLVLRCHPSNQKFLTDVIEGSETLSRSLREVQGDRSLTVEDCFLVSGQGVLDIGLPTQLETFLRAAEALFDAEEASEGASDG